jgi:hypothetical protein
MISRFLRRLRGQARPASDSPPKERANPSPVRSASEKTARASRKPLSDKHFLIEDYTELLRQLLAEGVRFETLAAPQPAKARAGRLHYIKHDIHHDLENTLRVAAAEHEIGVRSTFFMMHENPINRKYFHAPATWETLHRIEEMGHLIGLHVDGFLLIEQFGDLARGIAEARKSFADHGIRFSIGNTHGNSGYQKKYDFEPMNFYEEVKRPTQCREKLFMDHYGKYSLRELGFDVWADTAIWTPGEGEWLLDHFVTDNGTTIAAGATSASVWAIEGAKWDLSETLRHKLVDYVSQGSCLYLVHPQFFRLGAAREASTLEA